MGKKAAGTEELSTLSTERKKEAKKERGLLLLFKIGRNNVGIPCCIPYWQNLLYFHSAVPIKSLAENKAFSRFLFLG